MKSNFWIDCTKNKEVPAEIDIDKLKTIRSAVNEIMVMASEIINKNNKECILLDIAPLDSTLIKSLINQNTKYETLNLDPNSCADYIHDLTKEPLEILKNRFDYIICTEVIEHVKNPFKAMESIKEMLKPNGLLFLTVPFNFRIHNPLPDCWRISEHGIRAMLEEVQMEEISMLKIIDKERPLAPTSFACIAKKPQS